MGNLGNWEKHGKLWENYYVIISQLFHMVDAGRHKINCWVPESLWEKIEALGYDSPTKATIAGYEALIGKENPPKEKEGVGNNWENMGNNWENVGKQLEDAQRHIKDLEENLMKAPDPIEFTQLRTRSEELGKHNQALKVEMEKQLEFLKGQLVIKDQQLEKKDAQIENLTNTMQSQAINIHDMLNQKAIEAPGQKKWWKFW